MASKRKINEKTVTSSGDANDGDDGDDEGGNDSKRQCTTPTTMPVKKEEGPNNTITTATTNNELLPTPVKLSEELCKIVSDRYSRDEALCALEKMQKWGHKHDLEYSNSFYIYGGVYKVFDFLKATVEDSNCVGTVRMECIKKVTRVIMSVCCYRNDGNDKEIAKKLLTSAIDYGGIDTLINVSKEYSGGVDDPQLAISRYVWGTLTNITSQTDAMTHAVSKDRAIIVLDTGIDILSQLKSKDSPAVSWLLTRVFDTLNNVGRGNYIEKKYIKDKNILSKCVDVFRKDKIWIDRNEDVTGAAIDFFHWCRCNQLLVDGADYKMILPFLTIGLKKFPSSDSIRQNVVDLIIAACNCIVDKKIIERSGIIEPLAGLLLVDDVDEYDKNNVRALISTIVAPVPYR